MQKTHNLPPELAGKVVNIADIRAQRIGAQELSEAIAAQEAGEIASDMSMTEKVWWRNQQFFANRMARSRDFGLGYGSSSGYFSQRRYAGNSTASRFRCS